MMPVAAYVSVGSNIQPEENILEALRRLARREHVAAVSLFYRTHPVTAEGRQALPSAEQPAYINGVWKLETARDAGALKREVLCAIEEEMGRARATDRYAPRNIDLDLLLYGDLVDARARLPEPHIRERAYIAVPLLDLEPDLRLPDTGDALRDLPSSRTTLDMEPLVAFTERMRNLIGGTEK